MTNNVFSGQCLCGAVRVTARLERPAMGACHCGMCRKWGGGPLLAVECREQIEFQGDERIGLYDSSVWAQRGFCTQCGTHLFYRLKDLSVYALPTGLLDGSENFIFDHEVCIDRKPSNYDFANETRKMTESEMFANGGA